MTGAMRHHSEQCYCSQEVGDNEIDQMFSTIKMARDSNCPILIMGDFNYCDIDWDMLKADNSGYIFLKLVLDCYLEQHVREHTRMNNILDLVITSELTIKDVIRVTAPVDNSDHNVLIWNMECKNGLVEGKFAVMLQSSRLCYYAHVC